MTPHVVIVEAVRTPIGSVGGALAPLQAQDLATTIIRSLLEHSGIEPTVVEHTCMG